MIKIRNLMLISVLVFMVYVVIKVETYRSQIAITGLFLDILGGWFITRKLVKNEMNSRATSMAVNEEFCSDKFLWYDKLLYKIYYYLYLIPMVYDKQKEKPADRKKRELREAIGAYDAVAGFVLLFMGFLFQALSYLM